MGKRTTAAAALALGACGAVSPVPAVAAETIAYDYDARGRLKTVTRHPTPGASQPVVTSYARDKANNRVTKTTTGSPNP